MRILLADSQSKVRFALRVLLERQPGVVVVGEATDSEDLAHQTGEICPDMVLLSWELPGLLSTDRLAVLREVCPEVCVVALSGRPEARRQALEAGVDAFVSKSDPPERLLAVVRSSSGCDPRVCL